VHLNWLIIDGNNLIHSDPELALGAARSFELARERLVQRLTPLVGELADRITVVFDGKSGAAGAAFASAAVEVLFSPSHLSADSVIERMAHAAENRHALAVVTSDRLERDTIEATGVHTLSCRSFWEMADEARAALRRRAGAGRSKRPPPTLGDLFPRSSS
jgi:predicted RNA-binding protein with PIN domain